MTQSKIMDITMEEEAATAVSHKRLKEFIEAESEMLQQTLRLYVRRAGLATGRAVNGAARDLLNEVVVEALHHADRFQVERPPRAWLLGIAANLIKRRQAQVAKQERREPLVQDLYAAGATTFSEDELFEQLTAGRQPGPAKEMEMNESITTIMGLLSADDQRIIGLAVLYDLDGQSLATALGVKPGTARMRLHRALNRLRQAWQQAHAPDGEVEHHE
jgi:RNA polymerase sigma factor (sigma-70 family)